MTISTDKCEFKLKLQAEDDSCRLQCPLKTIIQIEDSSMPMQVKFAVQEGYNHDSIVTLLMQKKQIAMSTEMWRNESKQKLYILSRHATTVICSEYASIS